MAGRRPPTERSMDFKGSGEAAPGAVRSPSASRCTGCWSPCVAERRRSRCVGPKILGKATDLVFAGRHRAAAAGRARPRQQALDAPAQARQGRPGRHALRGGLHPRPGHRLRCGRQRAAARRSAVYVRRRSADASVATRLATRVDQPDRLPAARGHRRRSCRGCRCRTSTSSQRGEVLSRATNDIDNIAQTLQQTMGQLVNSLLTIVGVLAMMFWISPLLALVALVTVPLSVSWSPRGSASGRSRSSCSSGRPPASSTRTSRRCTPATRW